MNGPLDSRAPAVGLGEGLRVDLKDPQEAALYLDAALEAGSEEAVLLALRDVVEAMGAAQRRPRRRASESDPFEILTGHEEPRLSTLAALLDCLGLRLSVSVRQAASA